MSPRAVNIALALSVALNLLVICALVAAAFVIGTRWPQERHEGRRQSAMQIVEELDPEAAGAVRQRLRDTALDARPEFRAAREARREAMALAGAEVMDRSAVEAALERSRTAEMNGRARIESGVLDALEALEPEDRRRLAPILARRGPAVRHRRGPSSARPEASPET